MDLNEIYESLSRIEKSVAGLELRLFDFARYRAKISKKRSDYHILMSKGIDGLRDKILSEHRLFQSKRRLVFFRAEILNKLRTPHRKILDYLLNQYDAMKDQFLEINFSRLVRECRIGKNKANEYLNFLAENGLITRRSDGYRVWFRISDEIAVQG